MNILVTGATGFIGTALIKRLLNERHAVAAWVRSVEKARTVLPAGVKCVQNLYDLDNSTFGAVINLAGEPIADKRWTEERKVALRVSRVSTTRELEKFIDTLPVSPKVILSGSAIGYYGSQPAEFALNEESIVKDGFTHQLCRDWENAARLLERVNTRVCMLRTGIVLGKGGGAIDKMLLPFKLGLGGPIGSGEQIMSWVHIDDWIEAALFILENDAIHGPVNIVSPKPVSNETFSKTLGDVVSRPTLFRLPEVGLRLVMGEAAELLTEGQKVIPKKLLDAGYQFKYPELDRALETIVN